MLDLESKVALLPGAGPVCSALASAPNEARI